MMMLLPFSPRLLVHLWGGGSQPRYFCAAACELYRSKIHARAATLSQLAVAVEAEPVLCAYIYGVYCLLRIATVVISHRTYIMPTCTVHREQVRGPPTEAIFKRSCSCVV